MGALTKEPADPSGYEPSVTGSPETIWLVYGDLECDDTHRECCASGEVTWCEDRQFDSDVRYVREDVSELKGLRELADSEGTRAVEYLRRARKAEAEVKRLRGDLTFAAAPDMLAALRKAAVLLAGACAHSPELEPNETYEAVSAAIAKATGCSV